MAETVVCLVVGKLSDALIQEAAVLHGVRNQVEWLRAELRWMECFLKDADAKRRKGNLLVKNWVREVREVAHLAEDIIDVFILKIYRRQRRRKSRGIMARIRSYASSFPSQLKARHNLGVAIKELRAKIGQIKASREMYGLVGLADETTRETDEALQSQRRIYPHLDDETVAVGLDSHKNKILEQLLDASITRRFVVSIVGAGGLGKTTLANKIYNSREIKARFGARACVSVSQDHKVGELLKSIAKQVMVSTTTEELQRMEISDLREHLYSFLKERSYFIVLDDVWRTDVWKQVRTALPDVKKNGSRVLLTTRSMEVATSADPSIPPYQLPSLDDDESWRLFLKNAFPANQELQNPCCCPEELESIGRRLVRRCGGLPLALLVLGGLISKKDPIPAAWMRVADRIDWASTDHGEESLKILGLSYDDLPHHHLRSCFLYLGSFPEDSEISPDALTRLWIAEGFVPRTDGQTMEDTAHAYLDELVQRSMIQVDYDSMYRVHDLFRDLCIREAREDGALNVDRAYTDHGGNIGGNHTLRRLAVHNLTSTNASEDCYRPPPNLRSLLVFRTDITSEMLNGLKLLRVIHLEGIRDIRCLSEEIGSMIHLRYLSLRGCWNLKELPSSIVNLSNLQTLDVGATRIRRLPEALGKLEALRHLYLHHDCECSPTIANCINLQTLKNVGAGGGWIEGGFEKLINIRDLCVFKIKATQGKVFFDSIRKLKRLSSLGIIGAELISTEVINDLSNHNHLDMLRLVGPMSQPQLLSHHGLPPNLTQLTLQGSKLGQDPMTALEKLPNLVFLALHEETYLGKEMVCGSGGFTKLQNLTLEGLDGLEDWRVEAEAMPCLTSLCIQWCSRLTMLPEGLRHVASLRVLEVRDEREVFRDKLQPGVGEDWYKIRHVPSVTVDK